MAFNFDLNKLMQDPNFVSGVGLLGAASSRNAPLLTAFKMLQQQEQTKQEQARHQQNADLQRQNFGLQQQRLGLEQEEQGYMRDYRSAQAATSRVNAERYGQDIDLRGKEFQRKQQMDRFMMQVLPSLMQGGQLPPGMMPQGMEQPMEEPVGKYGTPKRILMNLKQIESGGNPLAMGPDIGGGVRAQGAFQFLPDTVKMLQAQGIKFDPFKPQEAEDAADFYIQSLVKKHGGDYSKALADYGGFKSKDPTQYVTKVLAGSPEQNARQHLQLQNVQATQQRYAPLNPTMNPGFSYKDGEFGMDFKPSYEPHKIQIDREKLEVDRAKAAAEFGPAGFKARESNRQDEQLRLEQEREQRAAEKSRIERETADKERRNLKAKDTAAFRTAVSSIEGTESVIESLLQDKNLPFVTGRGGLMPKGLAQTINPQWGNTIAKMEQVSSTQIIDMLQTMRKNSPTGAAGFGQFQLFEKEMFQAAQGLDRAKTAPEYRAALANIDRIIKEYKKNATDVYSSTYGEEAPPAYEGLPAGTRYMGVDPETNRPYYRTPDGKFVRPKGK